jgi:tripartite-type tricarboxylate transporter receptor subunit TctC
MSDTSDRLLNKQRRWRPSAAAAALLASGLAIAATAGAAQYPERPIRVVVPFAPGGNVDLSARAITSGLSDVLGVQVIVDNRPGAGGALGSEIVATARPDGYTLLVSSTGSLTIAPIIYPKLRYEPARDFAAVSLVANVPLVMIVNSRFPARTVKEFIAQAGGRELNMASSGNFSTGQLTGFLFAQSTGVKFVHIPYKGASAAIVELLGGQVDLMFDQISSAIGHIRGGRLRALAVTSGKRSSELPEVPTMREAGVPIEAGTFTALLVPAKTPREIVAVLSGAARKTLAAKAVQDTFAKLGADVLESTPESAAAYMASEREKWTQVIRTAGLKAE